MAVWDVGLCLNLHVLPASASSDDGSQSPCWRTFYNTGCAIWTQAHLGGFRGGRQQYDFGTQWLLRVILHSAASNKTGCAGEEEGSRENGLVARSCPELISAGSMGARTIPHLTVGVQVIVRLSLAGDHDSPKGKSNNIKAIKGILQELLSEIPWLKQDRRLD